MQQAALFARLFSYQVRQVSPIRYSFAEPDGLPAFLSVQYLSVRQKRCEMPAQMQRQANGEPVVQPVLFFLQQALSPVMTPFFAALSVYFSVFRMEPAVVSVPRFLLFRVEL